jgi:arginine decarboxylase
VAERYEAPFFNALKQYSHRPTGVFPRAAHPAGQVDRELALDQGHDRVLRPGHLPGRNLRDLRRARFAARTDRPAARRPAARRGGGRLGSRQTYFVTNGASPANRIVCQALVQPGDIVLVDRNCHQSHHYGPMLSGAHVIYLDAYPLNEYSMYGAVPLRELKRQLPELRAADKLDRVKVIMLTNRTCDGVVYDVERVKQNASRPSPQPRPRRPCRSPPTPNSGCHDVSRAAAGVCRDAAVFISGCSPPGRSPARR